jgi:hypothetical protein
MADLTNPRVIKLKGALFLVMGILSAGLLLFKDSSFQNLFLLAIAIWSFCRAYYFAFYVIEHYVDPGYKFAGLWSFARYLMTKRKK